MNSERSNSAGKFCIEGLHTKGPLHLHRSRKISQLESKAHFFEGQIDPLHFENTELKEQLIALTKMVATSTDILRHLLPVQQYPTRRLKLQLANLTQISQLIKQDWLKMEGKLSENHSLIHTLTSERDVWHSQYDRESALRKKQIDQLQQSKAQLKANLQQCITDLKDSLQSMSHQFKLQKQQLQAGFQRKLQFIEYGMKQYQLFKRQAKTKAQEYEKSIERLKQEIKANLISFEQSKKNLKQIYDKIMSDKISEQAEGYELMIKMKEEEKQRLIISIQEAEEEQKRKLALKEYQIVKLTDTKTILQEEIGGLKEQIWNGQLAMDKKINEEKTLHQKIQTINDINKSLYSRLEKQIQQNQREKLEFEMKTKKQEKQMQMLKNEGNKALNTLLEQKVKLQQTLEETTNKYKQAISSVAKTEAQFNSKILKLKEQWQRQQEILKQTISDTQFKLTQQTKALELSHMMNEDLILEHAEAIKKIEGQHASKQQRLIYQYENKLTSLSLESQSTLQDLKKKHEHQIKEANYAAQQELKQVIIDCNKKMSQKAEEFQNQLNLIKQEEAAVKYKLDQAELKIKNHESEVQQMKKQHTKQLQQLEEQNEREKQKLSQEMGKKMEQFQRQLQQKQAQLTSIKADMMNEIKMLKNANAVDQIQHQYQLKISKMQDQFKDKYSSMQQAFKSKYQDLVNSKQQQLTKMTQQHHHKIEELKNQYHEDLNKIAKKTQEDQQEINQQLLNGLPQQFQQLSALEKKKYIADQITNMKSAVISKDLKILELQQELKDGEGQIEKRVKARKEELELQKQRAVKDCQHKIAKNTAECHARVTAVEEERLQNARLMQEQFQLMKKNHQGEMMILQRKYNELQKYFEERPSRAEDLSKIKQLINMQSKMDIQIQSYQKKMETANEIVKYLNLQLQNYKDVYDIFGPDSDNKPMGIIGHRATKAPPPDSSYQSSSQSQQLMEVLKTRKHERKESYSKKTEQMQTLSRDPLSFRKWNDTPGARQLKLFQSDSNQDQMSIDSPTRLEPMANKSRRYSNLMLEKSSQARMYFKTEKSQKQSNQSQMMINAQNFIKLIKGREPENPVIKEQDEYSRRKVYRKRKVHKKHPTVGISQY